MKRGDSFPGNWFCWSCEFYGSGWVYFELQENGETFDLVNCPACHIAVIPRQLTQSLSHRVAVSQEDDTVSELT